MAEKNTKAKEEKQEVLFTKEQILTAKKYADRRDALGAILSDTGTYTLEKVDSLLGEFMKGQVK